MLALVASLPGVRPDGPQPARRPAILYGSFDKAPPAPAAADQQARQAIVDRLANTIEEAATASNTSALTPLPADSELQVANKSAAPTAEANATANTSDQQEQQNRPEPQEQQGQQEQQDQQGQQAEQTVSGQQARQAVTAGQEARQAVADQQARQTVVDRLAHAVDESTAPTAEVNGTAPTNSSAPHAAMVDSAATLTTLPTDAATAGKVVEVNTSSPHALTTWTSSDTMAKRVAEAAEERQILRRSLDKYRPSGNVLWTDVLLLSIGGVLALLLLVVGCVFAHRSTFQQPGKDRILAGTQAAPQ